MQLLPGKLQGTFVIELEPVRDDRGFFMRSYDRHVFADQGLQTHWEQESISFNKSVNTLRGLHFQMPPLTETKLIRVSTGAIRDVFVDLRRDSNTFGQWESIELSGINNKAVYLPCGFAHGFCTLMENTTVEYKIDVPFQAGLAGGIRWNDPQLAIDWNLTDPIISERDAMLPLFSDFDSPF